MTVEIKEMVVRTTISGSSRDAKESSSCTSMEEVKKEVLAVCMEWIADYLARQKER